jgi:ferritin-like protein
MAASSATLHEDPARLGPEAIDRHRAIVSIMEELEAADWYDQRVQATDDEELRAILAHNRDEEKEHAAMLLEWLRRHDEALSGFMKAYLFSNGPITGLEAAAKTATASSDLTDNESLGIGGLRGDAS